MKRRYIVVLLAIPTFLTLVLTSARANFDWADEFTSAHATINIGTNGSGLLQWEDFFDNFTFNSNGGQIEPGAWSPIGSQTIGGRANAVERLQMHYRELASTFCGAITMSNTRWQDLTPPTTIGASCDSSSTVGNGYVGSASYTKSSCGAGNASPFYSNRLLPNFSFNSPVPTVGLRGYVSRRRLSSSDLGIDPNPFDNWGCFLINWF